MPSQGKLDYILDFHNIHGIYFAFSVFTISRLDLQCIFFLFQVTADEAVFTLGLILLYRQSPSRYKNTEQSLKNTLILALQRLLAHQNEDGSFVFCQRGDLRTPSTFLTATSLQVLGKLQNQAWPSVLDPLAFSQTLHWLKGQQSADGSFRENYVFDGIYQRKIPIEFQEIALTSHVLLAFSVLDQSEKEDFNVTATMQNAADFLARRLEVLDRFDTFLIKSFMQIFLFKSLGLVYFIQKFSVLVYYFIRTFKKKIE